MSEKRFLNASVVI